MMEKSETIQQYFSHLDNEVRNAFHLANTVRALGYDPEDKVEILLAENMAERVEGLVSSLVPQITGKGIPKRIAQLEKQYGTQDLRVAFSIALEVAQQKFCIFKNNEEALEVGMRIGFAYITNGVVSSPLEGFTRLKIGNRQDGKQYFMLYFAGPIRSAGTTAMCSFIALADYLRVQFGYSPYDPTEEEIKRTIIELFDFHEKVTNLQYLPTEREIDFIVRHTPVQIAGEPSEKFEVSNYKDLKRVDTNVIRNGVCLVIGEGLTQKGAKFWGIFSQWNELFEMGHWKFLRDFVTLQKTIRSKEKEKSQKKIIPDYGYLKELVAGRPILAHPLASGGFRLRYGRARNSGFSSMAIHPATMFVLNKYIAVGTQLKVERPGKATVIASCDSLEGPIVKLMNGSVEYLNTVEMTEERSSHIKEILYLGDILVNYGDFLDRKHMLVPAGYCEEWWLAELKGVPQYRERLLNIGFDESFLESLLHFPHSTIPSGKQSLLISQLLDIPLHPRYTLRFKEIKYEDITLVREWFLHGAIEKDLNKLILPLKGFEKEKRFLELLGCPHKTIPKEFVVIEDDFFDVLFHLFCLDTSHKKLEFSDNLLESLEKFSGIKLRDKSGTTIGARMGRPEKAKVRKLTGNPQVLFPVGEEGGRLRSFGTALNKSIIKAQFPLFFCEKCKKRSIYKRCHICDSRTKQKYYCLDCRKEYDTKCTLTEQKNGENLKHKNLLYKEYTLPIQEYFESALQKIKIQDFPELIKGVRGMSNEDHVVEYLGKGILRALFDLSVNKDGTIRYDMTEQPITHFKCKEIGVSVEKIKQLGYTKDIFGRDLVDENQLIEIFPQDIILPSCKESANRGADDIFFRVAKFIDALLVKFYKSKSFYNLKDERELVGHFVIAMSPHTSAGIVGRIIGFSNTQGFLAHPSFHSIMRRDCDGDEAGVMLLLDALINFSRKYLPSHRGANQDEPLVLTNILIPSEVDDMVFRMDVVWDYPLDFYRATLDYKNPWEVKIQTMGDFLGSERQYEGFGFTHPTSDIAHGVVCSSYKSLPTMEEKVKGQMHLAEIIRAVDQHDVARLLLDRHFIRDIKGNLRKFSTQEFRCSICNKKFRRPPLAGKCDKCGNNIIFTVSEGSVIKYLEPSLSLAEKYSFSPYLKQSLELTKRNIDSVFGKDPEKQEGLGKWF